MKRTVIILSLIFALATALSVTIPTLAASDTGTTTITATMATAIDVTAPANFALGALVPDQATNSSAKTVTVKCNKAGWDLTVSDERITPISKGHMDDGTTALTNALTAKGGDQTSYAPLSSAVTLKSSGSRGSTDITDVLFQQNTVWGDDSSIGTYTITVTFTGTTH